MATGTPNKGSCHRRSVRTIWLGPFFTGFQGPVVWLGRDSEVIGHLSSITVLSTFLEAPKLPKLHERVYIKGGRESAGVHASATWCYGITGVTIDKGTKLLLVPTNAALLNCDRTRRSRRQTSSGYHEKGSWEERIFLPVSVSSGMCGSRKVEHAKWFECILWDSSVSWRGSFMSTPSSGTENENQRDGRSFVAKQGNSRNKIASSIHVTASMAGGRWTILDDQVRAKIDKTLVWSSTGINVDWAFRKDSHWFRKAPYCLAGTAKQANSAGLTANDRPQSENHPKMRGIGAASQLIYLADQMPKEIHTIWEFSNNTSLQILDEDVHTPFLCPHVPADFRYYDQIEGRDNTNPLDNKDRRQSQEDVAAIFGFVRDSFASSGKPAYSTQPSMTGLLRRQDANVPCSCQGDTTNIRKSAKLLDLACEQPCTTDPQTIHKTWESSTTKTKLKDSSGQPFLRIDGSGAEKSPRQDLG
ncbi:uncharacterized protein BJ212DRAFT_1300444 [Suillus subaureus]|uniref:Uncharacterized protein n=1 Tax=Suillus subaureus TaxID=48587 RepID=A0A9P7E8R2_9AGAM|nr:uncharacterized protein BJ212DRAFT_1300444 [Suillus subaureus]KAG1814638.1 hypothetical protein BJ212DRAFT_1300444 [Suillus subaureus]